jgi:hypothetical protein
MRGLHGVALLRNLLVSMALLLGLNYLIFL